MAYINTATKNFVYVNNIDVSENVIQGSVSEESPLASNIISSTGELTLGGFSNAFSVYDFHKTQFPVGSKVKIYCQLDDGQLYLHPRGTLYVINSSVDINAEQLKLEIGCSLAFLKQYESSYTSSVQSLFGFAPAGHKNVVDYDNYDLGTLDQLLKAYGITIYQDKWGNIQQIEEFPTSDTASKITFYDLYSSINIESTGGDFISADRLEATFSVDIPVTEADVDDDQDNDGIPDAEDDDIDGDDILNTVDPDTGNDGILDEKDSDGDGTSDSLDKDDDDNDIPDIEEPEKPKEEEIPDEPDGETPPPSWDEASIEKTINYSGIRVKPDDDYNLITNGEYGIDGLGLTTDKGSGTKWIPANCGSYRKPITEEQKKQDIVFPYLKHALSAEAFSDDPGSAKTATRSISYYEAIGNQISSSRSEEYSLSQEYASGPINAYCESVVNVFNGHKDWANEVFKEAAEFAKQAVEAAEECLYLRAGKPENEPYTKKEERLQNAALFYFCLKDDRIDWGLKGLRTGLFFLRYGCESLATSGTLWNLSSATDTTYEYYTSGQQSRVVTKTYVHICTLDWVKNRHTFDYLSVKNNGNVMPNLYLPNELVESTTQIVEYSYFKTYTEERTTFVDHINPANSTVSVKRSSNTSANPEMSPNEEQADLGLKEEDPTGSSTSYNPVESDTDNDGTKDWMDFDKDNDGISDEEDEDANANGIIDEEEEEQPEDTIVETQTAKYCDDKTESTDITVSYANVSSSTIQSGGAWFGNKRTSVESVSFPIQFKPTVGIEVAGVCIKPNYNSVIASREALVRRYLQRQMLKSVGDNLGFRVTEKMRANLFEYYPYYPCDLQLSSINKTFRCRSAASTWAFDSTNAICSIDLFVIKEVQNAVFSDPFANTVHAYTSGSSNAYFSTQNLNIPETAQQIEIMSLPENGELIFNGLSVELSQVIDVQDITSSNFYFVPNSSSSTRISFLYQAYNYDGDAISSVESIYPRLPSGEPISLELYKADGGDFVELSSTNGTDLNGGDFDSGAANSIRAFNGGDFDRGGSAYNQLPSDPTTIPRGNNSVNTEEEYGSVVVDAGGNAISTVLLPGAEGDAVSVFNEAVDTEVIDKISVALSEHHYTFIGFNYGVFQNDVLGYNIDFGSIDEPSVEDLDFSGIVDYVEPSFSSGLLD